MREADRPGKDDVGAIGPIGGERIRHSLDIAATSWLAGEVQEARDCAHVRRRACSAEAHHAGEPRLLRAADDHLVPQLQPSMSRERVALPGGAEAEAA